MAQLALCFALAGAAGGAIEAAEHVGVARYAPESLRFSAFGALSAVRSFGRLTATVGATVVWTALGPQWGMLIAAPLMVTAVAVMARGDRPVLPPVPPRVRRAAGAVALAVLPVVVAALLVASGLIRPYS